MVFVAEGLIPTRFLTLISHLTITIIILWSKEDTIEACLPLEYSAEEFSHKNNQMTVGLSIALGLIGVELLGFLSGISMFMPSAACISIAAHSTASVLLAYFLLDTWDCDLYWYIFAICSVVPAIIEGVVIFAVLALKKS